MDAIIISAERLTLRAWSAEDAEPFGELFSHPDVARFVNQGKPVDDAEARAFVQRQIDNQRTRGWCRWAVELSDEPGRVAGWCGVGCNFAPDVELGWGLRRDAWGRGIATEAARAALAYCLDVVVLSHVISVIDPANGRSRAVAERLGMRPDGTLEYEGAQLQRFRIDNPRPERRPAPGTRRDCIGAPTGSSLRPSNPSR